MWATCRQARGWSAPRDGVHGPADMLEDENSRLRHLRDSYRRAEDFRKFVLVGETVETRERAAVTSAACRLSLSSSAINCDASCG